MKKFIMNSLGSISEIENDEPQMSLRDYFAAKAMQAMMTAGFWNWNKPSEDADRCYAQADAMIKAREK
jgi:hypothetical protein